MYIHIYAHTYTIGITHSDILNSHETIMMLYCQTLGGKDNIKPLLRHHEEVTRTGIHH